MAVKPLFGTLNATLSKTLAQNAPKYRRIVEPFGDGGTWALELKKRRPKEHTVNIVDPDLFAALTFVQNPSGADKARLKSFDWVSSQETFDKVMAITVTEGVEHFYKFFYVKKFGMRMSPEQPPTYDLLSQGKDIKPLLFGLPLMKVGLKRVTILNDDPISVMNSGGGSDTFLILLPKEESHVNSARQRLKSNSASVFFAVKVADGDEAFVWAKAFPEQTSAITVPSIMLNKMAVVTTYPNKLVPLDPEGGMVMDDTGAAAVSVRRWRRVYRDPRVLALRQLLAPAASEDPAMKRALEQYVYDAAARVVRRETAAIGKIAKRYASDRDAYQEAVDEFYNEHWHFVAEAMRVSRGDAVWYCTDQLRAVKNGLINVIADFEPASVERLASMALGTHGINVSNEWPTLEELKQEYGAQ